MANFSVRVNIDETALEQCAYNAPQVKGAINKSANQIAANANGLATEESGIWHEVGKPHTPGREGGKWHGSRHETETIGGVQPSYKAKPARPGSNGAPIALVVTGNYAAQKDNMVNNTLLKAMG